MFLYAFVFILVATQSVSAQLSNTTESSKCREREFRCRNGVCIPEAGRCNGTIECPDKSDEIFALCRHNTCPDQFRCTYGACMSLSVRCDGNQDCADNSDELIPLCRNDFADFNICEARSWIMAVNCRNSDRKCDNGQVLPEPTRCDGHVDCEDGSDETLVRCAEAECLFPLFRCAYGGCAYMKAACDGVENCADGSDESFELCGRVLPAKTTTTPKPVCKLPAPPDHGRYSMGGKVQGVPGQEFSSVVLDFSCDPPYELFGESTLFCSMGEWFGELPKCAHFCQLPKHHSVEYRCPISYDFRVRGTRECNEREPVGTPVKPRCRQPVYYQPGPMMIMRCLQSGKWDQIVTCVPECGKLGPAGEVLLLHGRDATRNELPWHVAIYRGPRHEQMCSGTVVRANVVISAAHCFWRGSSIQPPSNYMVAAGNLYRTWDHPNDVNTTQTSEIKQIVLPARFQGSATNFQDDIAVLILVTNLQYTAHVRPVCIDFEYDFDTRQLKEHSVGKIAGWGLTERGSYSDTLRVADVPYVPIQDCIADVLRLFDEKFNVYITSDKICAGYKNGTALCQGDSGGGLTFPARERSSYRYYLRGVASTGFNNDLCNSATITSFTRVVNHEEFLQEYL